MRFDATELARLEAMFAAGQVPDPARSPASISPDAPPASLAELVRRRRLWLGRDNR
jgi:hypothetical protein